MHAIWSGSISFGLVNIPINLYSGADESRVDLHLLHKTDDSPIRYLKVCKAEGKEVPYTEIVKGYEYQKNEFVELDDKDFEIANVRATHLIDIVEFVAEKEIDIRFYEKPYYLQPAKNAEKAYALLNEALKRSKKVGLAKFIIHNREHIAVLKPIDGILVLNRMRYAGEIRDPSEIKVAQKSSLKPHEITLAMALIKQMTGSFKPQQFHDTYVEELMAIITAKAEGKKPKPKGKKPVNTQAKNLMITLQQSLKRARLKKSAKRQGKAKKAA